jgi:hypothetical protein
MEAIIDQPSIKGMPAKKVPPGILKKMATANQSPTTAIPQTSILVPSVPSIMSNLVSSSNSFSPTFPMTTRMNNIKLQSSETSAVTLQTESTTFPTSTTTLPFNPILSTRTSAFQSSSTSASFNVVPIYNTQSSDESKKVSTSASLFILITFLFITLFSWLIFKMFKNRTRGSESESQDAPKDIGRLFVEDNDSIILAFRAPTIPELSCDKIRNSSHLARNVLRKYRKLYGPSIISKLSVKDDTDDVYTVVKFK